jgi:hypothetical protein
MVCIVLAPFHAALPKIAGASAGVRDPRPDASFWLPDNATRLNGQTTTDLVRPAGFEPATRCCVLPDVAHWAV